MLTNTRWRCINCEKFEMTSTAPGRVVCPRCRGRIWLLMKDRGNLGLTYDGQLKVFATPKAVVEQNIPGTSTGHQAACLKLSPPPVSSVVIGVMQGDVVVGNHGPKVQEALKQRPRTPQWAGQCTQYIGDQAIGRTQPTPSSKGKSGDNFLQKIGGAIVANKDNRATRWRCIGCANVEDVTMAPMAPGVLFCHHCGGATWFRLDDKAVPRGGRIYGKDTRGIITPRTAAKGTILGKVGLATSQCNVLNIQAQAPCSIVIGVMQGDVVVSGR